MLTVDEIELPASVQKRLRERAAFSDSFGRFTQEHLAGFRQPVAAVAAVIGPILISFTYVASGFFTMLEVAVTYSLITAMFLLGAWFTNRQAIREAYTRSTDLRRSAKVDLKVGKAERMHMQLKTCPLFFEHAHGVIVIAEAEDRKTIFFDIDGSGEDPRWFLYVNGDMHRQQWRWIRLAGSGAVVQFEGSGQMLSGVGQDTPFVEAPDAWEAISLALGEPQDGELIDMTFEEVKQTISRLL